MINFGELCSEMFKTDFPLKLQNIKILQKQYSGVKK